MKPCFGKLVVPNVPVGRWWTGEKVKVITPRVMTCTQTLHKNLSFWTLKSWLLCCWDGTTFSKVEETNTASDWRNTAFNSCILACPTPKCHTTSREAGSEKKAAHRCLVPYWQLCVLRSCSQRMTSSESWILGLDCRCTMYKPHISCTVLLSR